MNFNPMNMLGGMGGNPMANGGGNPMGGVNPQMMMQMAQKMFGGKSPQDFLKGMSVDDIDNHTIQTMKQIHSLNPQPNSLIGILMEGGLSKQELAIAIQDFKAKGASQPLQQPQNPFNR